ncbi:transcriptional regulator [Elizabethkingia sp. HvH-WGS333]|uniref:FMN-binding negative transcriptional regulator n=1 Tax=Elizabethkingia TaxID=308865 RepID=UPI0007415C94|nr:MULTISPECIES: FMN-binding negative transcriptional regulator [Elizabethkingia]KUG10142.1 transcriptional regulator [Elizabethkingia miricola]MCL1655726.1 FMN-binding negative transcriptional regulator [Elizabethkingia miricola]MCL1678209.1 FMN-binding negative transcriptional regulator [Elizabethkingia miricola]MCP1251786.1 FMN-binding negative transcriptional regulator [Elizabethkingia sp. S0634]MDX8572566.1 FMN-binding negative transcriptional regulator [Elizabethkingia sp. HX QKY]
MHIPKLYKSEDFGLLKEIISNHSFGLLISSKEKLFATHSMFLMNGTNEDFMLETHISKANFQAKALKDGDQVLCDFLGAHTYISSSWYDHINVSTWNYEAVQVRGTIRIMTDEELYKHLEKLTTKYEKYQKCPMYVQNMGDDFVRKEMKGAFGMNIIPDEIFIKSKLSQNRNKKNLDMIIENLQDSGDNNALIIADKMLKVAADKDQEV